MPYKKHNSGQSVVEFVFILPIILFVCIVAISIGMFIYCKLLVVTSATQASKYGAFLYQRDHNSLNEDKIYVEARSKALYYIKNGISVPDGRYIDVDIRVEDAIFNYSYGDVTLGRYCVVKVTYPFTFIFPLSDIIFGNNVIPISYESRTLYLIPD